MGVVKHGNASGRAIKEKQAQADVLHTFKTLVMDQPFHCDFHWMASHQDTLKHWSQLSLTEKMNVLVDLLAKQALVASIVERGFIRGHFTFELIHITMQGK